MPLLKLSIKKYTEPRRDKIQKLIESYIEEIKSSFISYLNLKMSLWGQEVVS